MKFLYAALFAFLLAPAALAQPGVPMTVGHCLPADPKDAPIVFIGRPTEINATGEEGDYRHILYTVETETVLKGPVPKSIRFERTAAKPGQPIYGWGQEELRLGTAYGFALWFEGEDGAYHDDDLRECIPAALVIGPEALDLLRMDFPPTTWRERLVSGPGIAGVVGIVSSLIVFLVLKRRSHRLRIGPEKKAGP